MFSAQNPLFQTPAPCELERKGDQQGEDLGKMWTWGFMRPLWTGILQSQKRESEFLEWDWGLTGT